MGNLLSAPVPFKRLEDKAKYYGQRNRPAAQQNKPTGGVAFVGGRQLGVYVEGRYYDQDYGGNDGEEEDPPAAYRDVRVLVDEPLGVPEPPDDPRHQDNLDEPGEHQAEVVDEVVDGVEVVQTALRDVDQADQEREPGH